MKKLVFFFLGLILIACVKEKHSIEGIWKVNNNHYKATYQIIQEQNRLIGKVIYYNDGTTILHETGTDKDLFLFNLKQKNNTYVDAVSGATNNKTNTTIIKTKHIDSLEVTSYIMKKPITEIWIRKTKNNN